MPCGGVGCGGGWGDAAFAWGSALTPHFPRLLCSFFSPFLLLSLFFLFFLQLLAQAARLLSKLSNNSDAALLLSKLANLRELIQALRRNMRNEDFLKYGVYLLGNLALNDELKVSRSLARTPTPPPRTRSHAHACTLVHGGGGWCSFFFSSSFSHVFSFAVPLCCCKIRFYRLFAYLSCSPKSALRAASK